MVKKNMDKKEIKQRLGRAIAKMRHVKGLSQEKVAEQLGIGNEALSRIERGIVEPSVTRIFELATIFDCSIQDLIGEASPNLNDHILELAKKLEDLELQEQIFVQQHCLSLIQQLQRYH